MGDPEERIDVGILYPELRQQLKVKLQHEKSMFWTNEVNGVERLEQDSCPEEYEMVVTVGYTEKNLECGCWMAANNYNNFDGPYQGLESSQKLYIPEQFQHEEHDHEQVDYSLDHEHEKPGTEFQGKGSRMEGEGEGDIDVDGLVVIEEENEEREHVRNEEQEAVEQIESEREHVRKEEEDTAGFHRASPRGGKGQEQMLNGGRAKGVEPRIAASNYLNVVYLGVGIVMVVFVGMCMAYTKKEEKMSLREGNFVPASSYGTAL